MQLSSFKTYVKRDFKRTDKDDEILDAYNKMIVWVASIIPHGGYKYQSYIPTESGQEDYPLPSTMMHLMHPIKLLEGTGTNDHGYKLNKLTKEEYDAYEPNPNRTNPQTSGPWGYTVYSQSILLAPPPDASNTWLLEINWTKLPTDQSSDSDTPSLGNEWDEVLKWGVLERLYAGMGMVQEAAYWAGMYRDQRHMPIGLCKRLIDIERDREGSAIGQVKFNKV